MRLYIPYKVKAKHFIREGCKWVVYKRECGKVQPTYYRTKLEATRNKDYVSC